MHPLLSFVVGIVIGLITVGADVVRTMEVMQGRIAPAVGYSITISVTYFFGITFIANKNLPGYLGFSVGAAMVTGYLAWKKSVSRRDQGSDLRAPRDHAAGEP